MEYRTGRLQRWYLWMLKSAAAAAADYGQAWRQIGLYWLMRISRWQLGKILVRAPLQWPRSNIGSISPVGFASAVMANRLVLHTAYIWYIYMNWQWRIFRVHRHPNWNYLCVRGTTYKCHLSDSTSSVHDSSPVGWAGRSRRVGTSVRSMMASFLAINVFPAFLSVGRPENCRPCRNILMAQ